MFRILKTETIILHLHFKVLLELSVRDEGGKGLS